VTGTVRARVAETDSRSARRRNQGGAVARVYPTDITRLELSGTHEAELDTLRLLRRKLPDAYAVFHGVQGDTLFGEVDFAVVNRAGRVLVLEQKNGVLEENTQGSSNRYPDGLKPVASQLHRSLDHLRGKFGRVHAGSRPLTLDYLIYCPDHLVKRIAGAGLAAERIVHHRTQAYLADTIESVLGSPRTLVAPR
jgi:hypothetical protein